MARREGLEKAKQAEKDAQAKEIQGRAEKSRLEQIKREEQKTAATVAKRK